ncbi:MAG: MFS transporter [Gemmataceae bacterium]
MTASAPAGLKLKLAIMMFLQFFIWGAWFELGFVYIPGLKFPDPWMVPLIFGAFNIGSLMALFFSTQFADRKFAAEKFVSVSHLIGGLAIGGLFFLHPAPGEKAAFWPFFGLMLLHSIFYVPTISITNSIAFANLKDPTKEFGPVRLWGTIGWIVASWPFIFILVDWTKVPALSEVGFVKWLGEALRFGKTGADAAESQRYIFLVAGVASLVLSAFSLTLPHTPPKPATGEDSLAWLKAMKILAKPFVAVLFLVTFIDAAVHQSFFVLTPGFLGPKVDGGQVDIASNWVAPVMKIGQIAEILTMLFLGYVLKTFGWRLTMIIGVLGHAGRFAVFAFWPEPAPAILINILHGICYAFFFATVYIFIDEYFPKDIRSSAQGLFNVLILGVGPFVSNFFCNLLLEKYSTPLIIDGSPVLDDKGVQKMTYLYHQIFLYPMFAATIGAILLLVLFHPPKKGTTPT